MPEWHVAKAVRLTADIARTPQLASTLVDRLACPLPIAGCSAGTDPLILWQGPCDWMILCTSPADLAIALAAAAPVIATQTTLAEFHISADRLATGTALRPPPGKVAVTRFAQIRATILGTATHSRMFVEMPVARYVAQWLARDL